MPYMIEYESSFSYDLTGRRIPKRETRATQESAEARARGVLKRLGAAHVSAQRIGGQNGLLLLDGGPHYSAVIERT